MATAWASPADLVREGGRPADQAEGVRFLRTFEGRAIYAVGSGEYHFSSSRGADR